MTVKSPSASNPLGNHASKTHTTSKAKELLPVKYIKGSTDVLVVAPHGVSTEPMDDERTDRVASEIANQLGCSALINDSIKREERDYNRRNQAEKDDEFITNFRSVLDADGATLVLWIHGYDENNRAALEKQLGIKENGSLDCLIGYGQGKKTKEHHTAKENTVDRLIAVLADQGISAHKAVPEIPGVEYCGFDPNIMNQWCRLQQEYNDQNKVQSIQLEFRLPDFRDTDERAKLLGARIANAIRVMVRPTDEAIVPIAFEHLKLIFLRHFHNAMVEAGQYIINTFYDGNPIAALAKNKTREQPPNLKALVKKISEASSVTDDRAPSLGWFYNAVNLAAHEAICSQEGLQTFTMLGHSHKLLLLHVPKLKQIEGDKFAEAIKPAFQVKERLAKVAVDSGFSVREFAAEIKKKFPDENTRIDLALLPPREKLLLLSPDELRRLFNLAMNKVDESQKAVLTYGNALHELDIVLAETNGDVVPGKGRFQDWTKNNVNFCTGCKNDCIYCYMKPFNARNPKLKQPADWHNWEIRTEDVEKAYGLKDGWVGFPSSHDIFPEILDAYLTVLGKLLRAGNQVLIVSKPRIDCIKPICEACHFFKDKIIFRFTIGAMDDGILGFWEPNAPGYKERRACLEFAYNQGFRTSVSMEPMLDTPRIDEQIADLRKFVRKDENIWLGTMNYLKQIKEGAGDDLTAAIEKVEAGQTVEMLTPIYQKYKDDPMIEWKTDALEKITGKQQNGKAAKIFQAPAGNQVTVSIAAPEKEILETSDAVEMANKAQAEKVNLKEKPEALPPEDVSPASNSIEIPQANPKDEPKINRFRGKLA